MGWASGSYVANDIWAAVKKHLKHGSEKKVARAIIRVLEAHDWDTQDEAPGLMKAADWWRSDRDE